MKAEQLKNSILQLAIQGKLVKQNPNDEPAKVLLKKIKVEKEKLIEEKKIKTEKPLPEITEDEIPFEIPESWEWVRLGDIGQTQTGNTPSTTNLEFYNSNFIPFIKPADISDNGILYTNDFLSEKGSFVGRIIPKHSILMVCIGGSTGKSFYTEHNVCCNQQINTITPYIINSYKYLHYILKSNYFFNELKNNSGGTATPIVNKSIWSSIIIPLPPLEEQKRIVEKIEKLLPLIDEYKKAETELDLIDKNFQSNLKKSILQYAIKGKLVKQNEKYEPASVLIQKIKKEKEKLIEEKIIKREKPLPEITEDEKSFDLPNGWEWVRLGEIVEINPRNKFDDNIEASFIPMKLINDNFDNKHSSEVRLWKDIKSGFTHFAENDIGIAKITPCFENRKSVIFKKLTNKIGSGTTELHILRIFSNTLISEYLLWFVKTQKFISEGVKTYTGTAGQQRIGKNYIENSLIPLPPLEEQKRIVEKIENLMAYCDKLSENIN